MLEFTLSAQVGEPFAWDDLLSFLSARAIAGVERVNDGAYARTFRWGRRAAIIDVRRYGESRVNVQIHGLSSNDDATAISDQVRQLFDLDADVAAIRRTLEEDGLLQSSLSARPGLRLPGAWDGFEVGVRAILGQQVTVKGATTLSGRLVERYATPLPARLRTVADATGLTALFPTARRLADEDVKDIGLPAARAQTIRNFASAVSTGRVRLDGAMPAKDAYQALLGLKGIGPWTAQYITMRALQDRDAFPTADLVLMKAAAPAPDGPPLTAKSLEARAEQWRPWRAYAAMHLWAQYAATAGRAAGG